ncbi:MAG TPA: cupredoxin domain-containing protein [Solirubrobacter sp.]|nr:cupredoxin domain-containing protein [Solirubrobacter sp.]
MRRIAVLAAVAALLFAGCGGDDEEIGNSGAENTPAAENTPSATEAAGGEASTLKIDADPNGALKFTETKLTAKSGQVTVEFSNPSQVPHAVEIEGNGIEEETETVTGKDAAPITIDLKPGTYEFYCPVGNHRDEGMEGTLTVT